MTGRVHTKILLMGLGALSVTPAWAEQKGNTLGELQEQCVELRKQDPEHEYLPIVGRITKSVFQPLPADPIQAPDEAASRSPKKSRPTLYSATLTDTNVYGATTRVTLQTNWLKSDEMEYLKSLRAAENGRYGFCGEMKPRGNPKNAPSFYVHDAKTIQSIINE